MASHSMVDSKRHVRSEERRRLERTALGTQAQTGGLAQTNRKNCKRRGRSASLRYTQQPHLRGSKINACTGSCTRPSRRINISRRLHKDASEESKGGEGPKQHESLKLHMGEPSALYLRRQSANKPRLPPIRENTSAARRGVFFFLGREACAESLR
jgi:hypothetical protein